MLCFLFVFFINFDMMSNVNCSKTILCWKYHWNFIVFLCKNLIFCKFVRNYINSTELTFTTTHIFNEHEILVENIDKKHKWFLTYRDFKIAKKMMIQLIEQIVCWHHNDKEISVLKKVVINVNNNLLILHFKDIECMRKDVCTFC